MIRPDLTTLRLFLAVYSLRSMTKAAEREHIAPSAISKRIQAFEAEIDTQLFYRHARGVTPTPAGQALAGHAQRLFAELSAANADLSSYSSGHRGEVRIYAHSSAVIQYLPEQLAAFARAFPQVQVQLREQASLDVIDAMVDGFADVGIIDGNVPVPPVIRTLPYVRDRLIALVPAGHPLAGRQQIDFADISGSDHVSLEAGTSLQVLVAGAAKTSGFELNTRIEVRTFEAAIRMVEVGLGAAILPERLVRSLADDSLTRIVALADEWATRTLVLCIKDQQVLTSPAQFLLEHLAALTKVAELRTA